MTVKYKKNKDQENFRLALAQVGTIFTFKF